MKATDETEELLEAIRIMQKDKYFIETAKEGRSGRLYIDHRKLYLFPALAKTKIISERIYSAWFGRLKCDDEDETFLDIMAW